MVEGGSALEDVGHGIPPTRPSVCIVDDQATGLVVVQMDLLEMMKDTIIQSF